MKKVSLLTKVLFHITNILLIILYLYPGSILGWLIYGNIQKQPQITSDFIFSSNHVYAFLILSLLDYFLIIKKILRFYFYIYFLFQFF
jgi:Na+-transporting methylmalonyl-CoA/oxaloacetate decarboxylase beta subunit